MKSTISFLAPALAGLVLGGCGTTARASAPAPIPTAFLGQWLEVKDAGRGVERIAAPERGGFLALGNQVVVLNLAGLPHAGGQPIETALEGGVGAGRITLDNGLRLYLSLGRGYAEALSGDQRVLATADYLDVDVYRLDGDRETALGATRLWAESGVRLAASAPAPAPAVAVEPRLSDSDRAFIAAAVDARWSAPGEAARALVRLSGDGADRRAVAAARDRAIDDLRRDVLAVISDARADGAQAPALIAQARSRQLALASWQTAFARWWDARG